MDAKDLKIARLEREYEQLLHNVIVLLDSIAVMIKYTDVDNMAPKDIEFVLRNQKNTMDLMSGLIQGS